MSGFGPPAHLGDALSALLDGELAGPLEAAAHAHLTVCLSCARELQAVGQARTWVRALPAEEPPFGFYERMLIGHSPVPAGAFAFPDRAALRRRAGLAAIGAAAAAVTVLGVGSPRAQPANPAVPQLVQARSANASVGADLLSKLAPAGMPVSFKR